MRPHACSRPTARGQTPPLGSEPGFPTDQTQIAIPGDTEDWGIQHGSTIRVPFVLRQSLSLLLTTPSPPCRSSRCLGPR